MAEKKEQSLEDQSLEEIFSDLEQTIKEMEDGETHNYTTKLHFHPQFDTPWDHAQ